MRIAPVADLKKHLSHYLDQCGSGPVVVTKNGRAVAVLDCVTNDDDVEDIVLAHSPKNCARCWMRPNNVSEKEAA